MCSDTDVRNESEVGGVLAQAYKLNWLSSARDEHFDGYLQTVEGVTKAIVEVKRRNIWWGQHATIHLGEKKVRRCLSEAAKRRCAFLFAVRCDDGIYVIQLHTLDGFEIREGGRFNRLHLGITTDQEMMVHFPLEKFTKVL